MHVIYTPYRIMISSFSSLSKRHLRSSTVGRRLYSSPKHKKAPLQKCSRHPKTRFSLFCYTHQWSCNATISEHAESNGAFLLDGETLTIECINSKSEMRGMLTNLSKIWRKRLLYMRFLQWSRAEGRHMVHWRSLASVGCGRLRDPIRCSSTNYSFTSLLLKTRRKASVMHSS